MVLCTRYVACSIFCNGRMRVQCHVQASVARVRVPPIHTAARQIARTHIHMDSRVIAASACSSVEDRYASLRGATSTHSVLSVGVSCFQRAATKMEVVRDDEVHVVCERAVTVTGDYTVFVSSGVYCVLRCGVMSLTCI